jgi:PhzF family phenazine biosynthesis protein
MEIPFFLVNTFASHPFSGATSAVFFPATSPPAETLAPIVAEIGASDAAYVFHVADAFRIRWFDRRAELPLCTHATFAAAHAVLTAIEQGRSAVTFGSQGGPIHVASRDGLLVTDLPRLAPSPEEAPAGLARALRVAPSEVLRAGKYVVVYRDEADLRAVAPEGPIAAGEISALGAPGVIATAPSRTCDFVCRTFAMGPGRIDEEQVSASALSRLVPYWSKRLGKKSLVARQLSPRGAELLCEESADGRVHVAGRAVRVAQGTFHL